MKTTPVFNDKPRIDGDEEKKMAAAFHVTLSSLR